MQRAVHRVRRKLPRSPHTDLSNLGRFEVSAEDGVISASEFVHSQRQMHQIEITESDDSTASEDRPPPSLPPETFRARGQTGLEQFGVGSTGAAEEDAGGDEVREISRTFRSGEQVT